MANLQAGSVLVTIRRTIRDSTGAIVDISSASTKLFYLKTPKGKLLTKTATFTGTGTDGRMECTTALGDLDVPGRYILQAKLIIGTQVLFSEKVTLYILENVVR